MLISIGIFAQTDKSFDDYFNSFDTSSMKTGYFINKGFAYDKYIESNTKALGTMALYLPMLGIGECCIVV